jgi:sec-independent protein translocase protein TatA
MFGPGIGVPELLIVLVIVLFIFGAGRLKDLGKGIRDFRKALNEDDEAASESTSKNKDKSTNTM